MNVYYIYRFETTFNAGTFYILNIYGHIMGLMTSDFCCTN